MKSFEEFAEAKDVSKKKETEFHKKLDKLVHDTFGEREDEMEEDCGKKSVKEEVAVNNTGNVDMNPNGMSKRDKRKKSDTEQMYRRSVGLSGIKHLLKK